MSRANENDAAHWVRSEGKHFFKQALTDGEEGRSYDYAGEETTNVDGSILERSSHFFQYTTMCDLFKHYLDMLLKASIWYYAITGALFSYYLSQRPVDGPLPLLMLFVAVFSLGTALLYYRVATNLGRLRNILEFTAVSLGLPGRPHVEFAILFALLHSLMMTFASGAAVLLFTLTFDRLKIG